MKDSKYSDNNITDKKYVLVTGEYCCPSGFKTNLIEIRIRKDGRIKAIDLSSYFGGDTYLWRDYCGTTYYKNWKDFLFQVNYRNQKCIEISECEKNDILNFRTLPESLLDNNRITSINLLEP